MRWIEPIEREAGRVCFLIMARDTVLVQNRARLGRCRILAEKNGSE